MCLQRPWASRSMPARWAWRWPDSRVAVFAQRIDRRLGILVSLALLSIPTALLAVAPDLTTFTVLRIAQGLCMASAFTLMLAYLGEECSAMDAGGAFAAYITGNVASNLIGRLVSAGIADHLGLASNFYFFAVLNLAGAVLVYFTVAEAAPMEQTEPAARSPFAAWLDHLRNPQLRAPSASASASCSPSSARSPTSISFWCVRRCRSARWSSASSISCSCPRSSTTLLAGRVVHRYGNAADIVGLAGAGRGRFAASSAAQSRGGLAGHGPHRRRDVLCPGDRDGLREPSRNRGPRLGERHLSRLLLRRRPGRHRRPRSDLRPDWVAGLCRRNCAVARRRLASRHLPENAHRQPTPI